MDGFREKKEQYLKPIKVSEKLVVVLDISRKSHSKFL